MTESTDRKTWLGLLARAPQGRIASLLSQVGPVPPATDLRRPEAGSVMVQGRAGGTGNAFNLGEMTVTRCSLQLPCGTVGHGYVQGRSKADARAAAVVDALLQTDHADRVHAAVTAPLAAEAAARQKSRAAKAAATRVEFFTLVRGED
ncbi:MAG: alpha-D-ribose 1-methylphosphonate 5-triphosphate synthase subunit PhnG [Loktanella salsilacus]|jgi:alpha-D-ribose 1-methylphosphonate 5-triphosphate synthase subunit PhnG